MNRLSGIDHNLIGHRHLGREHLAHLNRNGACVDAVAVLGFTGGGFTLKGKVAILAQREYPD